MIKSGGGIVRRRMHMGGRVLHPGHVLTPREVATMANRRTLIRGHFVEVFMPTQEGEQHMSVEKVREVKNAVTAFKDQIGAEADKTKAMLAETGAETVKQMKGLQNMAASFRDLNQELAELNLDGEGSNSKYASADELSGKSNA